jgi:hypothetical protein
MQKSPASIFTFLKALDDGRVRWTACASLALVLATGERARSWIEYDR